VCVSPRCGNPGSHTHLRTGANKMAAASSTTAPDALTPLLEQIEQGLQHNSAVRLFVLDANLRRQIHIWCQSKQLAHVSFCDQSRHYEHHIRYFCSECGHWVEQSATRTHYCCTDGDGAQLCSDYTVRCLKGDDHIVWNQDGHEDDEYKRKAYPRHNTIAVGKRVEDLVEDFGKVGISAGKAANWMRKQERRKDAKELRRAATACVPA
jgi:NADH pyrophosphatase NudC (nudix superfamily)